MMVKVIEHKSKANLVVPTNETPDRPLTIFNMKTTRVRTGGQSRRTTVFEDTDGNLWVDSTALKVH